MNRQSKADLLLILATAFWGVSYYLSDVCLTDLPPMNLNAFRFLSAFIVLGIIFYKNLIHINKITLKYSLYVGLALTGTYILYGYGITKTSLSNASFICALAVVFTPIISFVLFHKRPSDKFLVALISCVVGLALLTLNESLKPAIGDIICMGVPICYATDLLITEKAVNTEGVDALALGVCNLGVVGVITLILSLLVEKPHLPTTPITWVYSLILGVICSGICFVIQSVQQQYTSAAHVGLIFTLEPVFASIVAFFFAHERLPIRCYVGMFLILMSLIIMEVDIPLFNKGKH